MQKVSKQSLAMIALSILLAISIALTFTFAALQDSKTATGQITFSDGFTLTATGFDGADPNFKFTINPTYETDGQVSFAIANSSAQWKIAATGDMTMEVTITLERGEGEDLIAVNPVALDSNVKSGTAYKLETTGAQTATITLANLIELTNTTTSAIDTNSVADLEYTITIDVKVVSSSTASDINSTVCTIA